MSQHFSLQAQSREKLGRSASRCLRREEKLPGVVYGAQKKPQALVFDHNQVLHALEHEAFYSSIIALHIDGVKEDVVIKDLQRHAYKPKLMHIDFLRVDAKTEIHVHVPLHFMGESPAVKQGGVLTHLRNEVEVVCLPKDLPEYIEVDLSQLELDQTIHLSELTLAKGVKLVDLLHGNDTGIANVHLPRASKAEEDETTETSEATAAEAPAAGSKE